MIIDLGCFDVIVIDNLFGDIIIDLVVVVCGGIGLVVSGNIDVIWVNLLMFELVYGSVLDIVGQGIVDLMVVIMLVVLLLFYFGEYDVVVWVDWVVEVYLVMCGSEWFVISDVGEWIVVVFQFLSWVGVVELVLVVLWLVGIYCIRFMLLGRLLW